MTNDVATLLATNIGDATDLPEDGGLRNLDSSMRCPVCGEFFDGPVTLSCGHCFCSLCLRNSLKEKQECPSCRRSAQETQLRANIAMEEIVTLWASARTTIINIFEERKALAATNKKRKRTYSQASDDDIEEIQFLSGPSKHSKKSENLSSSSPPVELTRPNDMVICPLCKRIISHQHINMHIDSGCTQDGISINGTLNPRGSAIKKTQRKNTKSKDEWSRLMNKGKDKKSISSDDPLPKVSYDTLKEKQVKELLQDWDLSVQGDKQTLVSRYEQWRILYNSNLDRSEKIRKSKGELQKELTTWEDQLARSKKKKIVSDVAQHQREYKDEFKALTDAARSKKSTASS